MSPASKPTGTTISRSQARPSGIIEKRANLLAKRELLLKQKDRLLEIQAFEMRLALLHGDTGWQALRTGRKVILRQFVQPQERAVAYLLVHQKAILHEIRLRGRRARFHGPLHSAVHWSFLGLPFAFLLALVWVQEQVFLLVTRSQRMLLRGVVTLPSTVTEGLEATRTELSRPEGRRGLARALVDERSLTASRRKAILFLSAIMLFFVWLVAELFIGFVDDRLLAYKHATDVVLGYSAAAKLFLPFPHEPVVANYAGLLGWPTAVLASSVGGCLGSWLLYLAGAEANKRMEKRLTRRPMGRKFWGWLKRNSRRYGYALMGIILSIPLGPDAITALFALLRLKMAWFLAVIFVSSIVRMALYWYFFVAP